MPFKSQSQRRKFKVLERQGKISPRTLEEWEDKTLDKVLPEKAKKRKK